MKLKPFGTKFMRVMRKVSDEKAIRGTCKWTGAPPNQSQDGSD